MLFSFIFLSHFIFAEMQFTNPIALCKSLHHRQDCHTFLMGSPATEPERFIDETLHAVTFTKEFEIQTTEVTQQQWYAVTKYNPSYFSYKEVCPETYVEVEGIGLCPNHPVETVSWDDTQIFIQKLNAMSNDYVYRLPTEAEWEYATRGGTQGTHFFGDRLEQLSKYAWFVENSNEMTHPVAELLPNQYGLYDVYGNVWEFTADWYADLSAEAQIDPQGPVTGDYRSIRGSNWYYAAPATRTAFRVFASPQSNSKSLGFRLVRSMK